MLHLCSERQKVHPVAISPPRLVGMCIVNREAGGNIQHKKLLNSFGSIHPKLFKGLDLVDAPISVVLRTPLRRIENHTRAILFCTSATPSS